ncbi:MAG: hypothetical protein Q4C12_06890 [Clostridia bacterium]|nr:hypothetical protein [Clostridia bacterium]
MNNYLLLYAIYHKTKHLSTTTVHSKEEPLQNGSDSDTTKKETGTNSKHPHVYDENNVSKEFLDSVNYGLVEFVDNANSHMSSINTHYYERGKTHSGIQYQSCVTDTTHTFYLYEDYGYGDYKIILWADYANNEDIISDIVRRVDNGEINIGTRNLDSILQTSTFRQSGYNRGDYSTSGERASVANGTVPKRSSRRNTNADTGTYKRNSGQADTDGGTDELSFSVDTTIPDTRKKVAATVSRQKWRLQPNRRCERAFLRKRRKTERMTDFSHRKIGMEQSPFRRGRSERYRCRLFFIICFSPCEKLPHIFTITFYLPKIPKKPLVKSEEGIVKK